MLPESFGGRIIYLLQQYGPSFLKGAGVSMWLALVGTLFGCIIGFLVGIVQTIPVDKNDSTAKKVIIKVVKFIMACYVEFFRGTPMMAQAMFIYFGSAYLFNINMSMWFAAIFIVSINTGAYMAETVRGGIPYSHFQNHKGGAKCCLRVLEEELYIFFSNMVLLS